MSVIGDSKEKRLQAFRAELETEGYDVTEIEPIYSKTITKRTKSEEDDSIGFVVVNAPIEIRDEEFDGEIVITVYEDKIAHHGVDIYSRPDDPLPEKKRNLLSELVPPREVIEDEEKQLVWSYYPPPEDLPDKLVDSSRNNVDELMTEFESIYDRAT